LLTLEDYDERQKGLTPGPDFEMHICWEEKARAIARRIRWACEHHRLIQCDLAEIVGTSPQALSRLLNHPQNMTLLTISAFEKHLNVRLIEIERLADSAYYYSRPYGLANERLKRIHAQREANEKMELKISKILPTCYLFAQ